MRDKTPQPQPWHAADEKPAKPAHGPIGTHSLTGGSAEVGLPESPHAREHAERSTPRAMPPGAQEPDLPDEPRGQHGDLLGHKPGQRE